MTNDLTLTVIDGEPRIDSRLIAAQLGVEHESFRKLVYQYQPDFEEFGILRFKIGEIKGRGQPEKYALLNEDQSYLGLTYCQNTEQARDLKKRLVRTFGDYRHKLASPQPDLNNPYSDFGPKAQFAVLEMLVSKVSKEIAAGLIDYLRERPASANPPPRGCPAAPTPPERPRGRPIVIEPADPWEAQAREFLANRGEATTTELLAYCGIPPEHQTQNQKNRAAKLLKYIGYRVFVAKRDHRCRRVYQRVPHA